MKRIISILVLFIFVSNMLGFPLIVNAIEEGYDSSSTNNYDIDSNLEEPSITTQNGLSLHPAFERRKYEINEQINIRFKLTASHIGIEADYESAGFIVANDVSSAFDDDTECQFYDVILAYNGITENPYFTIDILTSTGLSVSAKIFGYVSGCGLFISDSSYDAAKEASYYHLVETEQITMEEFNELLRLDYSQEGIETTDIAIQNSPIDSGQSTMSITDGLRSRTFTGTLGWIDDNNIWHPMQYNKVEIWDSLYGEKLGTVYTNVSGNYLYTHFDSYSNRNIYIKVYPGGENSIVKTGYGGDYVYTSATRLNIAPLSFVNISWDVDMTSDLGKAFQISQAINISTEYVREMNGSFLPTITVKYPHVETLDNSFYRGSEDTIYVESVQPQSGCPESYASWDVLMHEYGHHVQAEFGITNNPGLSHNFVQNLAVLKGSKDLGIRLAWGEAYASVFGGMAQAYYISSLQNINTVGDTAYLSYNGANVNYETNSFIHGEAGEASVISVLWDLYDASSESHDTISFSHNEYWEMIVNCNSKNLSEFCNYFINTYSTSYDLALGKLLSYHKMSASDLSVGSNTIIITVSWTANGTTPDLQNDRFDLVFLTANNVEILRINNITATSYTLSSSERNTVINSVGDTYKVMVIAYQTSTPMTGGYYSNTITVIKPTHTHSYSGLYLYHNNYYHSRSCSCGQLDLQAHSVMRDEIVDNKARCLGCNVMLDLTKDFAHSILSIITQVSINGSYILPSGIVVLVDEDVQAYNDGTLVFYHPDNIPTTQ